MTVGQATRLTAVALAPGLSCAWIDTSQIDNAGAGQEEIERATQRRMLPLEFREVRCGTGLGTPYNSEAVDDGPGPQQDIRACTVVRT